MFSKLGETANTNTQLTVSKDNFPSSGQRNLRVYCGEQGKDGWGSSSPFSYS